MMKAALIPPIPSLKDFGTGQFHLLLSHLLKEPGYRRHYRQQRREGAYLVLDNSAHENGKGENAGTLLKQGFDLDAQEIVVPDVLFSCDSTIETCLKAHEIWFESGKYDDILSVYSPAFMYVPQGRDEKEWAACFDSLVQIHAYCSRKYSLRKDLVVGVSKDYDVWDGGLMHLLETYVHPKKVALAQNGVQLHVHLLGWMRELRNLQKIATKHQWIRSTDSAKPFVYALAGINLMENLDALYPTRPRTYFSRKFNSHQRKLAEDNVWIFREAALGRSYAGVA